MNDSLFLMKLFWFMIIILRRKGNQLRKESTVIIISWGYENISSQSHMSHDVIQRDQFKFVFCFGNFYPWTMRLIQLILFLNLETTELSCIKTLPRSCRRIMMQLRQGNRLIKCKTQWRLKWRRNWCNEGVKELVYSELIMKVHSLIWILIVNFSQAFE